MDEYKDGYEDEESPLLEQENACFDALFKMNKTLLKAKGKTPNDPNYTQAMELLEAGNFDTLELMMLEQYDRCFVAVAMKDEMCDHLTAIRQCEDMVPFLILANIKLMVHILWQEQ